MKFGGRWRLPTLGLFGSFFYIFLSGLSVMVVSFAALAISVLDEATDRTLRERLAFAQVTAGRIDDRLRSTLALVNLSIAASTLPEAPTDRVGQEQFTHSLYTMLGPSTYFVAVIDPQRRVSAAYPPEEQVLSADLSASNCVRHAFEGEPPTVTRSFNMGMPTPVVAIVVGVPDATGQVANVVLVALNLNHSDFAGLLQPMDLGNTGYIEIIDRLGIILGSTRPELRWKEDEHAGQVAAWIEQKTSTVGPCHNCHGSTEGTLGEGNRRDDIVAFAPLTTAPWGVALRQSHAEAFAYIDVLRGRIALIGGLTFMLAAVGTWFFARRLARPLSSLTHACQEIANGNLQAPVPLDGPQEFQQLGQAFASMQQQLKASLEEIHGWTAELEGQIRERNRELVRSQRRVLEANRELETLNAIGEALRQSVDLQTTVNTALERVMTLVGARCGWICLTREGRSPEHAAARGCVDPPCLRCEPATADQIARTLAEGTAQVIAAPVAPDAAGVVRLQPEGAAYPVICVPLSAKGRSVGVMMLIPSAEHPPAPATLTLLTAIGAQIGLSVESALLFQSLREEEEVQRGLLRRLMAAQEEERQRVARELHDETCQALTALGVGLETALIAPADTPDAVRERLKPLKSMASGILVEIQRMIQALRPSLLDDLGLISAIDWYADTWLARAGASINWEIIGDERRLPTEIESAVFRLAQEAISNVSRHAQADNVNIVLAFQPDWVALEIEDDGQGFASAEVFTEGGSGRRYGLLGMRERVALLNGTLCIESDPGQGTRIRIQLPLSGGNGAEHG